MQLDGRHRHVALAMVALALLAALTALQPPCDEKHIALTMPEIRRLMAALILTRATPSGISRTGHAGAAVTKPPPPAAITSADLNRDREM
ncbi:hypothetical protein [Nonomuraea sp. NPDC049480]|uniref:hypothetical protein n=1 Tax=Nonomuraea sp. NPDC049480 TaxID=3364353 RepID=UPI00378D016C